MSSWAQQYILDDSSLIDDQGVWDTLLFLVAADAVSTDRPYLYMEVDFREALNKL